MSNPEAQPLYERFAETVMGVDIAKMKEGRTAKAMEDAKKMEQGLQAAFENATGTFKPQVKLVRLEPGKGPIFTVSVLRKNPTLGGVTAFGGGAGKLIKGGMEAGWKSFTSQYFPNGDDERMETGEMEWTNVVDLYRKAQAATKGASTALKLGPFGF